MLVNYSRNSFSSSVDPLTIEKRQRHFRSGSNISLRSNDSYHKVPLILKDNDSVLKKDVVPQESVNSPIIKLPTAIEKSDFAVNTSDSWTKPPLDPRSETKVIISQPVADSKTDDIVKANESCRTQSPTYHHHLSAARCMAASVV